MAAHPHIAIGQRRRLLKIVQRLNLGRHREHIAEHSRFFHPGNAGIRTSERHQQAAVVQVKANGGKLLVDLDVYIIHISGQPGVAIAARVCTQLQKINRLLHNADLIVDLLRRVQSKILPRRIVQQGLELGVCAPNDPRIVHIRQLRKNQPIYLIKGHFVKIPVAVPGNIGFIMGHKITAKRIFLILTYAAAAVKHTPDRRNDFTNLHIQTSHRSTRRRRFCPCCSF